jgi:release factor glutamine methyltransferase
LREGRLSALTTRAEALVFLADRFKRSGIEDPVREARLTLSAACELSAVAFIAEPKTLLGPACSQLEDFAQRRAKGEPLSKIVGRREFWGLSLVVSPDVLDPRPETETIVEAAVTLLADRRGDPLRILDLGVGSGAVLCALLHEFVGACGVGVDVSQAAVEVSRSNIEACGLTHRAEICAGDWTDNVEGPFDLIVSNPPYIPRNDIEGLAVEVRGFDPWLALDGGPDGLNAYRAIIPAVAALLAPGGWLIVEIGAGQVADVLALIAKAGFLQCVTRRDLAGLERVVAASARRGEACDREVENRHDQVNVVE